VTNYLHRASRRAMSVIGRSGARRRFAPAASIAVVALAACDPLWTMNISQSLRHATAPECIAATLRARPEVDSLVVRRDGELAFHLREPTGVRSFRRTPPRVSRSSYGGTFRRRG
jgi:hypothetical protein